MFRFFFNSRRERSRRDKNSLIGIIARSFGEISVHPSPPCVIGSRGWIRERERRGGEEARLSAVPERPPTRRLYRPRNSASAFPRASWTTDNRHGPTIGWSSRGADCDRHATAISSYSNIYRDVASPRGSLIGDPEKEIHPLRIVSHVFIFFRVGRVRPW